MCKHCLNEISKDRKNKEFCSRSCKDKWHKAQEKKRNEYLIDTLSYYAEIDNEFNSRAKQALELLGKEAVMRWEGGNVNTNSVLKKYVEFAKTLQTIKYGTENWIEMKYPVFIDYKIGGNGGHLNLLSWNIGGGRFIGGAEGVIIIKKNLGKKRIKSKKQFVLFIQKDYFEKLIKRNLTKGGGPKNGTNQND